MAKVVSSGCGHRARSLDSQHPPPTAVDELGLAQVGAVAQLISYSRCSASLVPVALAVLAPLVAALASCSAGLRIDGRPVAEACLGCKAVAAARLGTPTQQAKELAMAALAQLLRMPDEVLLGIATRLGTVAVARLQIWAVLRGLVMEAVVATTSLCVAARLRSPRSRQQTRPLAVPAVVARKEAPERISSLAVVEHPAEVVLVP